MKTAFWTGSVLAIISLVFLVSACGRSPTSAAASAAVQDETGQEPAPTNRIDIPPVVRSNLGITFARVERRRVAGTVRVPGAFELEPRARREYRMMLAGSVELLVDQYQQVAAGEVLYRVRSPRWTELQQAIAGAEQEIISAEAEAELARARVVEAERRLEILRARLDTLSAAEFRRADLDAEAAGLEAGIGTLRAEVRVAESKVEMAHRTRDAALAQASAAMDVPPEALTSSVTRNGRSVPAYQAIDRLEAVAIDDGVVERLALSDGAFAEPTALVVSTIDPTRVRFRATLLQSDLSVLGGQRLADTPARIVPPRASGRVVGEGVGARMMLGLEAHPDQRTIAVLAEPLGTRPWIRPGISAYLEVEVDATVGPALAIPRSAVVQDGLTHIFFRRDPRDPNRAIRVEADMGPSDGEWVVINSGLMLSDEVVLDGVYELKLAADRSGMTQRGGHFHADGTWHPDH